MRGDIRRGQSSFARYTRSKLDYLLFGSPTSPDLYPRTRESKPRVESVYDGRGVKYMADSLIISHPLDGHEFVVHTSIISPITRL